VTRARIALGAALLLGAAPFAGASHATPCAQGVEDVCYTVAFACQTLHRHDLYPSFCNLT
jgi:hypothetical protein